MKHTIRVWDPLIRLFHWSLVAAFVIAYVSGDEESLTHIYSGYTVMGLIAFRLLWGLIGTEHARFKDFVRGPAAVGSYIKSMAGRPRHYIGHNPAAGWMIIVMLVTLATVTVSGLEVYAIEEGKGPLAGNDTGIELVSSAYADEDEHKHGELHDSEQDETAEEFWEEIHEAAANFMLLLIVLHIAGVLISGYIHKENLVKAMITGNKPATPDQ